MIRKFLAVSAFIAINLSAFAGGFVTNTNQNVAFLRQPAQNAVIGVGAAYYNPAGVGFLDRRFHLSFNVQNATQTREITGTYAPFAAGIHNDGSATKLFKGDSYAPFLPSIDAAWRFSDKFFASAHFGIVGGGGKATFENGLGSLESQAAIFPALLNAIAGGNVCGYSVETHLIAKQYVVAGQINLGYRVNDYVSIAAGIRGNYLYNSYEGHMSNIYYSGLETFIAAVPSVGPLISKAQGLLQDRYLECTQTDFAWAPVVGIDVNLGWLNLAARYEFNTKVRLTNDTDDGKDAGMPQFVDGIDYIGSDIPGILSLGAVVKIIPAVRLNLGFHTYFDKNASFFDSTTGENNRQRSIDNNSYEFLAGLEWDINKKFTVSAGGQLTRFGWDDSLTFITDQSFNINSYSLGAGVRYNVSDRVSLDFAVFKTFYDRTDKQWPDYNNAGANVLGKLATAAGSSLAALPISIDQIKAMVPGGTDSFYRTNTVFGVGMNIAF